ncbi:hypothetical protein CsSME_00007243 [Camellia sinensis var. sinensis]
MERQNKFGVADLLIEELVIFFCSSLPFAFLPYVLKDKPERITQVFFGSDFITVTKSEDASWDILKPEIFAAIMDFYSSGKPLFLDANSAASMDTAISEDDSEIVAMIKELLETRIRPAVQDDGGDIEYWGFDP